jgi:tartrate dehydrogenase/decarboxylase / D-malate dehydrogenase
MRSSSTASRKRPGRAMTKRYSIAVIAGDGIGPEVIPAARAVVDAVAVKHGFSIGWTDFPWGSEYYHQHGMMMAPDGIEQLSGHDAILLGAVGTPEISDVVTLWGLLIPIRRQFHQYINLRPVWTLPGVSGPLAHPGSIDLVIVRENVEGEYSEIGGRLYRGRPEEAAVQEAVFTRAGIARVIRFACKLALSRRRQLVSATKSNGIVHTMPFWDEVTLATCAETPDVKLRSVLVDALAAELVLRPATFDVIAASNLFGDILSDLTAALTGSIGVAASGNLNPERAHPSMFEPVHGSAPDIAGQGIANPVGQMFAAAMMLDHLGEQTAAIEIRTAVETALGNGVRTPDLGGAARTVDVTAAVIACVGTP